MTNPTLTDRYIDAAMRSVPEDQRSDLTAELRASIADQIDARVSDGEAPEAAERDVLTGLGDPDVLAASYTDRPLWLIGPAYYLTWRRLLRILLAIVVPCAMIGVAIGTTIAGESIGQIFGTTLGVGWGVIVNLCFWTTAVFAFVERQAKGDPRGAAPRWTLADLPEPRESGARLSDLVSTVVLLAVGAGAVLWDQFVGIVYRTNEGGWIPFLSHDLWPVWITGLLVIMVLEIIRVIVVYAQGRYTMASATWGAALTVLFAVPAIWLLVQGRLLNPDFWPTLIPDPESAATVNTVISILLGFGIALIAVWNIIDGFRKARRA